MIDFPDYEANIISGKAELRDQFAFAHRLHDYWLQVEKDSYIRKSTLDIPVRRLALTLNVQACRHFRSIIALSERCEATDAIIIARSLFETAVALQFVLAPEVYIGVALKQGRTDAWRAAASTQDSDLLTNRQRAALLSSTVFNDERFYRRWKDHDELKEMAENVKPDPAAIAACEGEVGREWSFILRNRPHTYSGLPVAELAKVLGNRLDVFYGTVYYFQSKMAHAADALRHASDENGAIGPRWMSKVKEIDGAIVMGIQLFLVCVTILQDHFGFGEKVGMELNDFRKEFLKAFGGVAPATA